MFAQQMESNGDVANRKNGLEHSFKVRVLERVARSRDEALPGLGAHDILNVHAGQAGRGD
jgi:hypothetical protein